MTVTADAGSPVLTARITGRDYLGDTLQREIEIVPGSTVTIIQMEIQIGLLLFIACKLWVL